MSIESLDSYREVLVEFVSLIPQRLRMPPLQTGALPLDSSLKIA